MLHITLRSLRALLGAAALCSVCSWAIAQPSAIDHNPAAGVFGEPAGVSQREPEVVREGEAVSVYMRVSFQFAYNRVAVYYTTNGTEPFGSFGNGTGSTIVATNTGGQVQFLRNENTAQGVRDWWRCNLPPGQGNTAVRYKIGAWSTSGGPEIQVNGSGNGYQFDIELPWPGAGAGQPNPASGYPPVSFWKEEAIFGNTFTAGMIDQNATVYDFHFPTPGGVYGVGTLNEGYVGGLDTFPPLLPANWRGQMHLNQAMAGIRVDGLTHWLSNPNGVSFNNIEQAYVTDTNTVRTAQRLFANGNNIDVEQFDFAPIGITFPADNAGGPQRHIYLKRLVLTNRGPAKSVDVYWYVDPAINGGDTYDAMYVDAGRGAIVAYDNTYRVVTGTGTSFTPPNEYNPTTSAGYEKNKSLYLASAMKVLTQGSSATESVATSFWRDSSADNGQGWMAARVFLPTNTTREVNIIMAGAADDFAGAAGTYAFKLANVIDWFYANNIAGVQSAADAYWTNWLHTGVTVQTPEARFNTLFSRGLLATALHVDSVNGGVIAGFHNGAYPYVWPRDAVYAAISLARTGHLTESENVYRWMRDVCYRDFEAWGRKGFWKQKYSTDGYVIWGAPQVDETSAFPWGVRFHFDMTADTAFLAQNYPAVRDSVLAMTTDSSDSRLRWEEAFNLTYSNNVWEDSYDTFIYSNASVWKGLVDARNIALQLGNAADAADAFNRQQLVKQGMDARLDWDGENTDISQLGIVYPFDMYPANDFRAARVMDRINGVRRKFNNSHPTAEPLVNFSGEHAGTINRYWGDNYWNGGPWFLSTAWYGLFYAERQDLTPGTADIDNHKQRLDLLIDRLGPIGMGAEQIAYSSGPGASLLYPGQSDFLLQTAWPNAWESMSTFADSVMKFLDYTPNASQNSMAFEPKLPSDWSTFVFRNITLRVTPANTTHRVDVAVTRAADSLTHSFTNNTGFPLNITTTLRSELARCVASVTLNGTPLAFSRDAATGRVTIGFPAAAGVGAISTLALNYGPCCGTSDFDGDGDAGTDADIEAFFACLAGACCPTCFSGGSDFDGDGDAGTDADIEAFFRVLAGQPC